MAADFFFQPLCQRECVRDVLKLCGQCWLFAKSQSSSKATDKATAGGWVEGGAGGCRGLQRAQCLSSSRSSTPKKRLINQNLIGWRGDTFSEAAGAFRTLTEQEGEEEHSSSAM